MFAHVDKGGVHVLRVHSWVNRRCVSLDLLVYLSVACTQPILNREFICLDIYNRKWHTRNYVLQVHCLKFALTIALLTASFTSLFLNCGSWDSAWESLWCKTQPPYAPAPQTLQRASWDRWRRESRKSWWQPSGGPHTRRVPSPAVDRAHARHGRCDEGVEMRTTERGYVKSTPAIAVMVYSLTWTPPQDKRRLSTIEVVGFNGSTEVQALCPRSADQANRIRRCMAQTWGEHRRSWTFCRRKAEGCRRPCSDQRPSQPRYILPRGQGLWRSNTAPDTAHRKWFLSLMVSFLHLRSDFGREPHIHKRQMTQEKGHGTLKLGLMLVKAIGAMFPIRVIMQTARNTTKKRAWSSWWLVNPRRINSVTSVKFGIAFT